MKSRCYRCNTEREVIPNPPRRRLHVLPELRSPLEIIKLFTCASCGSELFRNTQFISTDKHLTLTSPLQGEPAAKRRSGKVWNFNGKSRVSLEYPAVSTHKGTILFPVQEGRLSGGHVIDQHGDPDLMAEFSAEYFKQYLTIVPKGRLPQTMTEMMPALHLLMNAAELALKADLIRSNKPITGHVLQTLYQQLEDGHRSEIEKRFNDFTPNANLYMLGVDAPTVESVLSMYEYSFSGSSAYMETRYFAEPTTMLKSAGLKGGNVIKGGIPYPIFLPFIVQIMLDVYALFSRAERLKRLGATVGQGTRDPGEDQYGDWGFVPSSIGLVAIRVAQFVASDEHGETRDVYRRFKTAHPPGYYTSWKYAGDTLLFYRTGEAHLQDGETVIDGLECKIWYAGCLGMHARDLYLLADTLEAPEEFPELQWEDSLLT